MAYTMHTPHGVNTICAYLCVSAVVHACMRGDICSLNSHQGISHSTHTGQCQDSLRVETPVYKG